MAAFAGLADAQTFLGTVGVLDTVSYLRDTGGVTVNVETGGSAGFADGDQYDSIERYWLTNNGFTDIFIGSAVDEMIFGYGGFNRLDGAGGNDYLQGGNDGNHFTGGTGVDTVIGGDGDDIFVVRAGDSAMGDFIKGDLGTDSIELIGGGTFNLALQRYYGIESITLMNGGILIMTNNRDEDITFGGAGTEDSIRINSWVGGEKNLEDIYDNIMTYLGNGFETVTWERSTGDVVASLTGEGDLSVAYINNGGVARSYTAQISFYDASAASLGALQRQITHYDSGVQLVTEYDTSGGAGNEVILTQTYHDLSMDGAGASYQTVFRQYDLGGVADGILDYTRMIHDNGLWTESTYDISGNLTSRTRTDLSMFGTAVNYQTETLTYHANGQMASRVKVFDPGERFAVTSYDYDPSGMLLLRVLQFQNGTATITGSVTDQVITAGDGDDGIKGGGGADIFVFETGTGSDLIHDFDLADDKLDLSDFGIDTLADLDSALSYASGNAYIDLELLGGEVGDMLMLRNISEGGLTDANFL